MDKESIFTRRKEFSDNFFSLAESHLGAVRGLVERLDDDQLGTQLQIEKYERKFRMKGATEGEKSAGIEVPEDQPPKEAREKTKAAIEEHLVDTEDTGDPGAKAEQPELGGVEEPE